MTTKRKSPRISPVSFYLGAKQERVEHLTRLDALAKEVGAKNRSDLLKRIAKGEVKLVIEHDPTPA